MNRNEKADLVAQKLASAEKVTVLTGAGVSAPSGVPTFRGEKGLWRNYSPEDLATPGAFKQDPKLVWQWYDWRRGLIAKCEPNEAHRVLAKWATRFSRFDLITQNVDGLHERAGSKELIRFHGSIWMLRCFEDCSKSPSEWWDGTVPFEEMPPSCPYCSGLVRPGVVWFGETINPLVLSDSFEASACDVFLSIGTSSVVYPAASLLSEAKRNAAFTVEINLEPSASEGLVDCLIEGSADQVLFELDEALGKLLD